MNHRFEAFVAGVMVARLTRRPTGRRTPNPLAGLSPHQGRVALALGQLVGCLVSGTFLGYEFYLLFVVR